MGRRSIAKDRPSLASITRRWSTKSKSIWNRRSPWGMGLVVRPCAVTYSGTCHQWFSGGVAAIRILPTICVHMCTVVRVSAQPCSGPVGRCEIGRSPGAARATLPATFRRVTPISELTDPFLEPREVLGVVVAAGLRDPPGGLGLGRAERGPFLEHPRASGVGLDPGHVPRLVAHGLEEFRVQAIDVDRVALVGPRADPLELDLGLGEPGAQVGDAVAH